MEFASKNRKVRIIEDQITVLRKSSEGKQNKLAPVILSGFLKKSRVWEFEIGILTSIKRRNLVRVTYNMTALLSTPLKFGSKTAVWQPHLVVVTNRKDNRVQFLQLLDVVWGDIAKLCSSLSAKVNPQSTWRSAHRFQSLSSDTHGFIVLGITISGLFDIGDHWPHWQSTSRSFVQTHFIHFPPCASLDSKSTFRKRIAGST